MTEKKGPGRPKKTESASAPKPELTVAPKAAPKPVADPPKEPRNLTRERIAEKRGKEVAAAMIK